jgi:hypothetical protein
MLYVMRYLLSHLLAHVALFVMFSVHDPLIPSLTHLSLSVHYLFLYVAAPSLPCVGVCEYVSPSYGASHVHWLV